MCNTYCVQAVNSDKNLYVNVHKHILGKTNYFLLKCLLGDQFPNKLLDSAPTFKFSIINQRVCEL